jgi:hypothetical protein
MRRVNDGPPSFRTNHKKGEVVAERLFITEETGARCSLCRGPYRLGDEVRLYLTEDGVQQAHEACAANAKMRTVCLNCKKDAPEQRICECGANQRVVVVV